jgi:hypothetical protein
MKKALLLLAALVLVSSAPAYAGPVLIDHFASGEVFLVDNTVGGIAPSLVENGLADVLGGKRTTTLNLLAGDFASVVINTDGNPITEPPAPGVLKWANNPSDSKSEFTLLYDGMINENLLAYDRFRLAVDFADQGLGGGARPSVMITVNGASSVTKDIPASLGGPYNLDFMFSDFAGNPFGSVNSILFTFNSNDITAFDGTFEAVGEKTGPEPATLLLFGAAALGFGARMARRRR